MRRFLLGIVLSLWTTVFLSSQSTTPQRTPRFTELQVNVSYENDPAVADQVKIQLTNGTGITLAESFTQGDGSTRFPNIQPGTYRVRAIGRDIEERLSEAFVVTDRDITHIEFLRIRKNADSPPATGQGVVSVAALKIPAQAQAEFDKGVKALRKANLEEAERRFTRSTEYYPQYAGAWNNLGVIAKERGRLLDAKSFFARAVQADAQYAPAHLNLAKALIGEKDYRSALPLLTKSDSIDPNNAETLALMTMLEYDAGLSAAAVSHARKVHGLPDHDRFAFVHYIAGSVLEARGSLPEALVEYKAFLKESPASPSSQKVRAAVQALENKTR